MRRRTLLLGAFPALSTAVWAKVREDSLPFPPYRIVGNVYYVGSNDITSFLITSPQGHAIINSGYEETVPIIRDSVRSLGFQLKDIKELLTLRDDPDASSAAVREKAVAKLGDIDQRIKDLETMKAELTQLVAACDGSGSAAHCPILTAISDRPA